MLYVAYINALEGGGRQFLNFVCFTLDIGAASCCLLLPLYSLFNAK